MKKLLAVLLSCVALLGVFSGCGGNKDYLGKYYSKEARAMNGESILTIYEKNGEKLFKMEHRDSEGNSNLIEGKYDVISERRLTLNPETQSENINNKSTSKEIEDKTPIKVDVNGDVVILNEQMMYIKEGSKTAETDTVEKTTKKEKN